MGICFSKDRIEPNELNGVESGIDDVEKCKKRNTTDTIFLLIHSLVLVILIPLLFYCVHYGNIYRIINGYDSCGNICGKENLLSDAKKNSTCVDQNMKSRPYILVFRPDGKNSYMATNYAAQSKEDKSSAPEVLNNTIQRVCLQNCSFFPHYRSVLNRCVQEKSKSVSDTFLSKSGIKDFFEEVTEDFELCWREILYLCLISLVFSFVIMVLLRYLVGIMVWLVLIGVVLACLTGTIVLWILWKESRNTMDQPGYLVGEVESRKSSSYLAFAIIATIVTVCVALVILVLRKRIQLVIQLFKEAGKAAAAMPLILLQPILTFICITGTVACWIYFSLWIESAGHDKEVQKDFYVYEKDFWIRLTRWYNIFVALWMIQFIIGCQHMVIAGAISEWYFTRNKDKVKSPIFHGFYNLMRYHLGSVSLGSLLIAVVQLIRICFALLQKYLKTHEGKCVECCLKCCQCCLYCLEKVLKYITKNAYIEIAIHGYSFCEAGHKALKILTSNALRVATINSVGDFVLFFGKVLVIMATVLIGIELIQKKEGILHAWVPLTLAGLFAYFISHCFLSVYEMAIDTIFICFCEDCEENDGISRPYFMSRGLMEFVENSKKAILEAEESNRSRRNQLTTVSSTVS